MKKIAFLLGLIFSYSLTTVSQEKNLIMGVIVDDVTEEAVPFATIALKNEPYGVISNANGSFQIALKKGESDKVLQISCIGYKVFESTVSKLKTNELIYFKLKKEVFSIDEITVVGKKKKGQNAYKIVQNAIKNIPANYQTEACLVEGYYRDYLEIDDNYLNMYEALVQVEDLGFLKSDYETSKINLIYGKMNTSFGVDSTKILNYGDRMVKNIPNGKMGEYSGGNELAILRAHDPVRNYKLRNFDFIRNLDTDFLDDHQFEIQNIAYDDGEPVYVISFRYKKRETAVDNPVIKTQNTGDIESGTKHYASGTIYIGANDYSIKKWNYTVNTLSNKFGDIKAWELNLEYTKRDEKSYLNYISFNNAIEMNNYNDTAYFYLETITIDRAYKRLVLKLNNELMDEKEVNTNSLNIKFHKEKLAVKELATEKNLIYVYLDDFDSFFSNEAINNPLFDVKFSGIKDVYGNKIDELRTTLGYQFREFFTTNISKEYTPLNENDCIDVNTSLFKYKRESTEPKTFNFNSPLLLKE